jgi:ribonuclease III
MNPQLDALEKEIDLKFTDQKVLLQALIHRSHLNENKGASSNERFEFLGDAILELWATEKLFTMFPEFTEGDLTNLRSLVVCTQNLAAVAAKINLGQYILLSRGEETHGGRQNQSILADTFESLIGAIYLNLGPKSVNKFLSQFLQPSIDEIAQLSIYKDPKSQFQEIAQSKRGVTPHYLVLKESGPDHKKVFEVGAYIADDLIATGSGNSKQRAEESAATAATQKLSS